MLNSALMTFRITSIPADDGETLRIAGRLEGEGLTELDRAVAAAARPLTIDLSDLQHADAEALALLAQLEGAGVRLARATQYLRLRLDQMSIDGAP
jgi:ABC-type transporter Mla MlaB component